MSETTTDNHPMSVWSVVEISGKEREWSVNFKWMGWRRAVSFGFILNVRDCAVSIIAFGAIFCAGRLRKTTRHASKFDLEGVSDGNRPRHHA